MKLYRIILTVSFILIGHQVWASNFNGPTKVAVIPTMDRSAAAAASAEIDGQVNNVYLRLIMPDRLILFSEGSNNPSFHNPDEVSDPIVALYLEYVRNSAQYMSSGGFREHELTLNQIHQAAIDVLERAKKESLDPDLLAKAEMAVANAKMYPQRMETAKIALQYAERALYAKPQSASPQTMQIQPTPTFILDENHQVVEWRPPQAKAPATMPMTSWLEEIRGRVSFAHANGRIWFGLLMTHGGGDSVKYTSRDVDENVAMTAAAISFIYGKATREYRKPFEGILEVYLVDIGYTPIFQNSGQINYTSNTRINWQAHSLNAIGYAGSRDGAQQLVNDKRQEHHANWGVLTYMPYAKGYTSFLGSGTSCAYAFRYPHPHWHNNPGDDQKLFGAPDVCMGSHGAGLGINHHMLIFVHEAFAHPPGGRDLYGGGCESIYWCDTYKSGEMRYNNSYCYNPSAGFCNDTEPIGKIMYAPDNGPEFHHRTIGHIGWGNSDQDFGADVVDRNYELYRAFSPTPNGFRLGDFLVIASAVGGWIETYVINEYNSFYLDGKWWFIYDWTDELGNHIPAGAELIYQVNWNDDDWRSVPSPAVFSSTNPEITNVEFDFGNPEGTRIHWQMRDFMSYGTYITVGPGVAYPVTGQVFFARRDQLYDFYADLPPINAGTYSVYFDWYGGHVSSNRIVIDVLNYGNYSIGDFNLNMQAYEIADALMYSDYFINGFNETDTVVWAARVAASDCNIDGTPLTVSDLVYMIRVITGDAVALKVTSVTSQADVWLHDNTLVIDTDQELGGLSFVLTGCTAVPTDLSAYTKASLSGDTLRVLVLDRYDATTVLASGRSTVIRFSSSDKPKIVRMTASTVDGGNVELSQTVLPTQMSLGQNYPNPFNATTVIQYAVPVDQYVELVIYNLLGQRVKMLAHGYRSAGNHSVEWDGFSDDGQTVASGVYFYALNLEGERRETKRMLLLK